MTGKAMVLGHPDVEKHKKLSPILDGSTLTFVGEITMFLRETP